MKKIIIGFDDGSYPDGALLFIDELNSKEPLHVVGIFLPLINYAALWSRAAGKGRGSLSAVLLEDEDVTAIKANIARFRNFCKNHHISHDVHEDFNDFAIPQLKKESRFADLLIIGSEWFSAYTNQHGGNDYLEESLHRVECPVLIVPQTVEFPKRTILAYDGSADAAYAIRQFASLLPAFRSNDTSLLYVHEDDGPLPDEKNIMELVSHHFPAVNIYRKQGLSGKEVANWLGSRPASILVTGSYGRSAFSRLFHKSFVAEIVSAHKVPVFIAHHS